MHRFAQVGRLTVLVLLALTAQDMVRPGAAAAATDLPPPPGRLRFEIAHTLPRETARRRVELLTTYWREKYGVRTAWSGNGANVSGRVLGIDVEANLEVNEQSVGGTVKDPGFFLRGIAYRYLTQKFSTYLDPRNDW